MPTFDWLAPALSRMRRVRGLSQTALAERAGISKSRICLYEKGRQLPSLPSLGKILDALDSNLVELQAAMVACRDGRPLAPWCSRPAGDAPREPGPDSWSDLADIIDAFGKLAHRVAEKLRALVAAAEPDEAGAAG